MNDPQTPSNDDHSERVLARLIARMGVAGVAVLLASVALAVGGPHLDLPGVDIDTPTWAAGSALLGTLLLLALQGLVLRRLDRLHHPRPGDPAAPADPASAAPALRRAQAQLHRLALAVPQGVALSRDRRFEWANEPFCKHLGWSGGELLGRSPFELFSSVNADDSLGAALRSAFAARQPYAGDLHFRRRDGSRFWGRLQARQVDPKEPAAGTLWQLDDVTAQYAQPLAPAWAAGRDLLTGLPNRAGFEVALAAWLARAPAGATAALMHLDLDGFKAVNDGVGRDAGDALLRAAAVVLQAQVRAADTVARLEGDTYALLLPGCVAAVAVQLGERLRLELAGLGVNHQGRRLGVGATVGVAEVDPRDAAPASEWLARGQAAWYEAKYGGRGAVRLAAPGVSVALVLPA